MANLNYNHLHYFWIVATVGSIARAAQSLHVTPQTISGQLRTLEERLGAALFERRGRKLVLTETGKIVHSYAERMFDVGLELGEVLAQRAPPRAGPLQVGIAAGIDKTLAARLLAPAMNGALATRVLCHEARHDVVVSALLAREIDLAITDAAVQGSETVAMRSYAVGQSSVGLFAPARMAERCRARFPASLNGAPLVLPGRGSPLARALSEWLRRERIAPAVVGEVESPELAGALAESYGALLAFPTIAASDVQSRYRMAAVGEARGVVQSYYVACAEPARRSSVMVAIVESAQEIFRSTSMGSSSPPEPARTRFPLPRSA